MRAVWYSVGTSSVDVNVSAKPNGNMRGIQPKIHTNRSQYQHNSVKRHTSSVFHCEAALVHLVLLRSSPWQQVNISRFVPLHLESAWSECPLLANEYVEVIIRSMQSSVSLGTKGRTKDDEIFSDGCVNDVHGTHGTPSIVKHPFRGIGVERNLIGRLREG